MINLTGMRDNIIWQKVDHVENSMEFMTIKFPKLVYYILLVILDCTDLPFTAVKPL